MRRMGFYIYIPDGPFDGHCLHYAASWLAEGLVELGIPVFSNLPIPGAKVHGIGEMKEHVYVFHFTQRCYTDPLMKGVAEFAAPFKAILSMADTVGGMLTPPQVPSFLAHENENWRVNGNRIPIAFGLTQARLAAIAEQKKPPFEVREDRVLANFSPSMSQGVRNVLSLGLLPQLTERGLSIDGEASDPAGHFGRLSRYKVCCAYGGDFVANYIKMNPAVWPDMVNFCREHVAIAQQSVVMRWDSWRFWESLASGCLTMHLDFEKLGFKLPVMPRPWEDYIPVDLADLKGTVERFFAIRGEWEQIAENGRSWATTHYTPKASAQRVVDQIHQCYAGSLQCTSA